MGVTMIMVIINIMVIVIVMVYYYGDKNYNNGDYKNAGHDMAIVGEPCDTDSHAKIPALFMSMLCPRLRNMSSTV